MWGTIIFGDVELIYSHAYSFKHIILISILLGVLSTSVYAQDSHPPTETSPETPAKPKSATKPQSLAEIKAKPKSQIQVQSSQNELLSSSFHISSSSEQAPPISQPALVKKLDSILYPQAQDTLKHQVEVKSREKVQPALDTIPSQAEPPAKSAIVEQKKTSTPIQPKSPVAKQPTIKQKSIKKTPSIGPPITPEHSDFNCKRPRLEWKWDLSYFSRDHLKKQIHIEVIQDTNRIYIQAKNKQGQEIQLEFDEDGQRMWYGINDVPRGLALHHLRERLFDSPLLLEDFKVLNRLVYQCPEHDQRDSIFLKDSLVSYSNLKTLEEPSAWKQYQYRWKAWKHWYFKAWLQAPSWETRFPSLVDITGQGEETARLQLKSLKIDGRVIGIPQNYPIPIGN